MAKKRARKTFYKKKSRIKGGDVEKFEITLKLLFKNRR
jgi:hypothetical protein